jgi:hypothetical protein
MKPKIINSPVFIYIKDIEMEKIKNFTYTFSSNTKEILFLVYFIEKGK